MLRILICATFVTVLSGGSAVLIGLPTQADDATLISHRILTGPPASASAAGSDSKPGPRFGWPLAGSPTVVRAFQPPAFRYGAGHRGVDLAAVAGTPVLAAGGGTVVFAGTVAGHGVVSVDHPGGLRTTYEPVTPTVIAGHRVARGERIGILQGGHPGCPGTACLHWGVLRGSEQGREYLDPVGLLTVARVRLLPVNRRRRPTACSAAAAPPWCGAGIPVTR